MGFSIKPVFKPILNIGDKVTEIGHALGVPVLSQIDMAKDCVRAVLHNENATAAHPALETAMSMLEVVKQSTSTAIENAVATVPPGMTVSKSARESKKFLGLSAGLIGVLATVIASKLGVDAGIVEKALTAIMALVSAYQLAQGGQDFAAAKAGPVLTVTKE